MITAEQAMAHLRGIESLCVEDNSFLSCVRNYLMECRTDVIDLVRADTLGIDSIAEILSLQNLVSSKIKAFMSN